MLYSRGESFKRLGGEYSRLIDQQVERVVEWRGGEPLARKGICRERVLQVVCDTTQAGSHRRGCLGLNLTAESPAGPEEKAGGEGWHAHTLRVGLGPEYDLAGKYTVRIGMPYSSS